MPAIVVTQTNGARWLATHCEVVIPIGGTQGMSPAMIVKAVAQCEVLSKRLANHHRRSGAWREYYASVEEFERFEADPALERAERSPREARAQRPGVIYLAAGNGSYKIGRSSSFPDREHQLTTKLPFAVEVIHTIRARDTVAAERFWHERFSVRRVRGEWFKLGESEVAEFCSYSEM